MRLVSTGEPRIAPPLPRRTLVREWLAAAKLAGIKPMPWQRLVARHLMAVYRGRWLYTEVAIVVARQNGKSEILVPRILRALEVGERVMHTAQDRSLPREIFTRVADLVPASWLRHKPRLANGQEKIETWSGGVYRIVAPTRGGARGPTNDLVIIDETREMDGFEFIAGARPTLTASRNGQTLYLSNAGDETSVVLNSIRDRATSDPSLGYIEYSAAPGRALDDRIGWAEANPALGHTIREESIAGFLKDYAKQPAIFETEHLCRWVGSMLSRLVADIAWQRAIRATEDPKRPALGVAIDPDSSRISAVIAWRQSDGTIGLRSAAEIYGEPVDVDAAGKLLRDQAMRWGVTAVGYSPATDKDLARYFERSKQPSYTEGIAGQTFAAACSRFVATLEAGRLRVSDAGEVGADLGFTVRKDGGDGTYQAVASIEGRPITAALAAIRAVWLATSPRGGVPTVH